MAEFEAKKLELTKVNGGQEYEQGDFLQSDTINAVVEGTAYAQNAAEEANAKSDKAVSTANSANGTANAASEKVDEFDERITTAQNKANTAYDNAATAQSTADSATTEINKIKNGTTVVPNANHANNADNANLATKAKQDVNGNSIVDTYATKNEVAEKQGTKVYYGSALQTSVTFDSNPQTQITANKNAIAEAQSDINDIVSGAQTVGKASQDADGNKFPTTYAKLSQVVRTDAAQSLTDSEAATAHINTLSYSSTPARGTNTAGWYQIAFLRNCSVAEIKISGSYWNAPPNTVKILVSRGYGENIAIVASSDGGTLYQKVRTRHTSEQGLAYVDVYIPANTDNPMFVSVTPFWNKDDADVKAGATDVTYIGTEDKPSDTTTVIVDIINGINTSGQIYQQGAPVFATDPSKLEPSTANGWTQTTATGSLPSSGVYMVIPNAGMGTLGIGIMFYTEDRTISVAAIGSPDSASSLFYTPSGDTKWVLYGNNATIIQLTDIYYKRIA